jgi:hypothetical protein
MLEVNMNRVLSSVLVALLVSAAPLASAQGDELARLSNQYSTWAGGKSNADALISGLRNGSAITLVTTAPDQSVSLAGFTPARALTPTQIRSALASAQQALARYGIARPNAEQIQAALIGGDVFTPSGTSRQIAGVVGARGVGPVASR